MIPPFSGHSRYRSRRAIAPTSPTRTFARGELPRVALAILREAGEPLPIRVIAARALARKDCSAPTRRPSSGAFPRTPGTIACRRQRQVTARIAAPSSSVTTNILEHGDAPGGWQRAWGRGSGRALAVCPLCCAVWPYNSSSERL